MSLVSLSQGETEAEGSKDVLMGSLRVICWQNQAETI